MRLIINGKDWEPKEEVAKVLHVEKWFDRIGKSWVVQVKDQFGNQVGEATFVYTRLEAENVARRIKAQIKKGAAK